MPPLVTVAMPVFNGGRHLRMAVLSIVKQSFLDWELILVDDGSTDSAVEGLSDIQDSRVRIVQDGTNRGLAARLNECIDLARGQYLARMDQDDVSYPERFGQQVHALESDRSLDLVTVRSIRISPEGEAVGLSPYAGSHQALCARPWLGFYLPHPTWMGRIGWFRKYRYPTPGPYYSEDLDVLLRSYRSSHFRMLPDVLFAYRVRRNILWRDHGKARLTGLVIRSKAFWDAGQWGYVVLTGGAFVARLAYDCWRLGKQALGRSTWRFGAPSPWLIGQWEEVRRGLL